MNKKTWLLLFTLSMLHSVYSALPVAAESERKEVSIQVRRWHGVPPQWFLSNGDITVAASESECRYGGFLAYQIAAYANAGMLDFTEFADSGRWHREVRSRCEEMELELKKAIVPSTDFAPPVPFFVRPYITSYCNTVAGGGQLP
ncbi:MAG: hypothetical protein PHN84_14335 [Desulfuromonadaceae bacterium]|nr:hypothetical protein [Desulfuromonadaceae bacterium]MDD2856971.1 hypothetical protein [Desulfuromonadaceae bacterium]